jgi:excisionase family DNA binding protein
MKSAKEISPREAAISLGIRLDAFYCLLWSGRISARKIDGRRRVSAADVEKRLRLVRERNNS